MDIVWECSAGRGLLFLIYDHKNSRFSLRFVFDLIILQGINKGISAVLFLTGLHTIG